MNAISSLNLLADELDDHLEEEVGHLARGQLRVVVLTPEVLRVDLVVLVRDDDARVDVRVGCRVVQKRAVARRWLLGLGRGRPLAERADCDAAEEDVPLNIFKHTKK